MHQQFAIEIDAQNLERSTASVMPGDHVHALLGRIELHLVGSAPLMQLTLTQAHLSEQLLVRDASQERLPRVQVICVNDFCETTLGDGTSGVFVHNIPQPRPQHSPLENHVGQYVLCRLLSSNHYLRHTISQPR